jgi:hypothetical protein
LEELITKLRLNVNPISIVVVCANDPANARDICYSVISSLEPRLSHIVKRFWVAASPNSNPTTLIKPTIKGFKDCHFLLD